MKKALRLILLATALRAAVDLASAQSAARQAGYLYLSPVPGAPYVSAQTRYVLVRFENVPPAAVTNLTTDFLTVTGVSSGPHSGLAHVASDGRTVIFEVAEDFNQNELVTVALNPQLASGATGLLHPFEYQFMIMAPMPGLVPVTVLATPTLVPPGIPPDERFPSDGQGQGPSEGPKPAEGDAMAASVILPNGVSVPSDFPAVVITVNSNPSPGYLFIGTGYGSVSPYTMILDNNGLPVWYRRGAMTDFKIQKNGVITWTLQNGSGIPAFDENFNYLQTYFTVNGYLPDAHEMKVLEDGSYLMLGYRTNAIDLSLYVPGGSPKSAFLETVIQEFTAAGELILQWRSWDHYDIRDQLPNTEFSHMNGLDIDEDGSILVSARHQNEITKINRDSGEIIWRLSGAHSSFSFVNDPLNGTSWQHHISALGNGHYLVFDNGDYHSPPVSRAVEYQLDLTNMTATLIWQFRDAPDKYAFYQGSAQRLPGGNTLINFVMPNYPKATEVDKNGVKHFELNLVPSSANYRTFRFPWNGVVAVPYLIVEPQRDNVALIFNKFGDTNVAYYRIYGGTSPSPTTLLATSPTTLKHLTNVVNGVLNYFRVTAVSDEGVESDFSNEGSLAVNLSLPGQNMVLNGNFSSGTASWIWQVTPPASAQWLVAGGINHFAISSGGTYNTDVQLRQAGMKLTQGKEYTFEFDAWSVVPRTFEAKVEQNITAGINYSGIQPFVITPVTNHYNFHFTMQSGNDNNGRVVFNAGVLPTDVYFANVSLRERVYAPGDFDWDSCVGLNDLRVLTGAWQKTSGPLTADLNGDGKVNFADFVIFSKSWTGGGLCP